MRILVTGAEGFIGRQVVVALKAAGHTVIGGVRRPTNTESIACDFSRDLQPEPWVSRLTGVDVVVNAVGILREADSNTFENIHVVGPRALFQACQSTGVQRVIQISALGSPESGEYLASKHRGDAELATMGVSWTVLRPSLVYSVNGSYGGTSLLRALAALPGVLCVPGQGSQAMQPVAIEDLAAVVVGLLDKGSGVNQIIPVVGPRPLTLLAYLLAQRRWLGLPTPVVLSIPLPIARMGSQVGEHLSNGPLGVTMWRMLLQGNVASTEAAHDLTRLSGVSPRSLQQMLDLAPSYVQDRWHARLYFLAPVLRIALGLLWLGSAMVGILTPLTTTEAMFGAAGLPLDWVRPLVWSGSMVDLLLGILAIVAWRPPVVAALMALSVAIYTVFIGTAFPSVWFEPLGGLLKNLPLIPAVLMMGVLSRRR